MLGDDALFDVVEAPEGGASEADEAAGGFEGESALSIAVAVLDFAFAAEDFVVEGGPEVPVVEEDVVDGAGGAGGAGGFLKPDPELANEFGRTEALLAPILFT